MNKDGKTAFLPDWIKEKPKESYSHPESSKKKNRNIFLPDWITDNSPEDGISTMPSSGSHRIVSTTPGSILIKGGNCVIPHKGIYPLDIYVRDKKILALGKDFNEEDCEVLDVSGKYVIPGVVDPHTHLGVFGRFDTEVFSETRSAVLNGVTTLGVYIGGQESYLPTLGDTIKKIKEKSVADVFIHLPIFTKEQLEEIPLYYSRFGITSFKAYMCGIPGIIPHLDEGFLLDLMQAVADLGKNSILNIHAENYHIVDWATDRMKSQFPDSINLTQWKETHPGFAEAEAIQRASFLAARTGTTIYFVHVSSKESIDILRELKAAKKPIYAETTSPYLTMTDKTPLEILAKMVPPIGTEEDKQALWQALKEDIIDTIGTDHTPQTVDEKNSTNQVWDAIPGYPALGTHVPFLLGGIRRNSMEILHLVEKICVNPAKIFGIYPRKGTILPGSDADLVVIDTNREDVISPQQAASRSDFALQQGEKIIGWPVLVIKGGIPITRSDLDKNKYAGSDYLSRD